MGLRYRVRALLQALFRTPAGMRLLMAVMKDDRLLDRVTLDVANRRVREMTFGQALVSAPLEIKGFEDLGWLYSSNRMNLGLSLLRLDEAAYLFRLVKSRPSARVAEIGRYKGGTTLLLAAAGARVVSIDNDATEHGDQRALQAERAGAAGPPAVSLRADLVNALRHFHLEDRVDLVTADSTGHPVEPESFDIVVCDAKRDFEGALSDFDYWWPAVAPGGVLIFRDGREPLSPGVVRACAAVRERGDAEVLEDLPGAFLGFRKPAWRHSISKPRPGKTNSGTA